MHFKKASRDRSGQLIKDFGYFGFRCRSIRVCQRKR